MFFCWFFTAIKNLWCCWMKKSKEIFEHQITSLTQTLEHQDNLLSWWDFFCMCIICASITILSRSVKPIHGTLNKNMIFLIVTKTYSRFTKSFTITLNETTLKRGFNEISVGEFPKFEHIGLDLLDNQSVFMVELRGFY